MSEVHGYGQLRLPGTGLGPRCLVALEATRSGGAHMGKVHLKVADAASGGQFEVDLLPYATRAYRTPCESGVGAALCHRARHRTVNHSSMRFNIVSRINQSPQRGGAPAS